MKPQTKGRLTKALLLLHTFNVAEGLTVVFIRQQTNHKARGIPFILSDPPNTLLKLTTTLFLLFWETGQLSWCSD